MSDELSSLKNDELTDIMDNQDTGSATDEPVSKAIDIERNCDNRKEVDETEKPSKKHICDNKVFHKNSA